MPASFNASKHEPIGCPPQSILPTTLFFEPQPSLELLESFQFDVYIIDCGGFSLKPREAATIDDVVVALLGFLLCVDIRGFGSLLETVHILLEVNPGGTGLVV